MQLCSDKTWLHRLGGDTDTSISCSSDYCNIDPRYGTLQDFDRLVKEAKKRNIKILYVATYVHFTRPFELTTATFRMDLVVNHTSDEASRVSGVLIGADILYVPLVILQSRIARMVPPGCTLAARSFKTERVSRLLHLAPPPHRPQDGRAKAS